MGAARRARSGSCSTDLPALVDICRAILTPKPLAVVLTAYSIRASFFAIHALMRDTFAGMGGTVESGELDHPREIGRPRAVDVAVLALGGGMNAPRPGAPGQVKEVTSLANPLVKDIKALALKKFRDQQHAFMAEGLKLVIDALDLGWSIKTLVFAKAGIGNPAVEKVAARTVAAGGLVLEVSEKVLSAITRRDNPQMVVGVFAQKYLPLKDIRPTGDDVWVALDRVRDPGNLGTVIRTIDAVGAKGLILVGETTDPFSLETVRATMGSVFAVPVARATAQEFLAWRRNFPGLVAGTHLKGAVDYRSVDYAGKPVLLLMGNEQQGLPDDLAAACDRLLRIPQAGRADSLNLAVATGVMLFEIRRAALKLAPEAGA